MYKRFLMISAIILTTVASAEAKVKLPHLIADNMVLQQCSDARLWGWSDKGKTVKVAASWSEKTYTAKAGKDGRWLVKVETPAASYTPHTISFDDYDAIVKNAAFLPLFPFRTDTWEK